MEKLADDAPLPVDNDANTQELQAEQTGGFSGQGKEALKDIAYGSLAGALGKIVEYPFDTVKVRLQSQPDHLPLQYTGPLDCFRQSWRKDGVAGLYRGIEAPMIGAAVETSSLFFSYRLAQRLLQATAGIPSERPLPMSMLLVCGAASGAFTSILLTPIELIKCKLQVPIETPQGIRKVSALTHIADVYRHRGLSGFWHGQMGTLIRETGGSAAWFGSYEGIKILQKKSTSQSLDADEPVYQQMIAGAVAGMSYNFLCYPADTIKSRLQTEDVTQVKRAKGSFWVAGRLLWQQQGLKGLYRGCGITVARAAPSSALIFSVYEALRKYLG